jgi:hypothetical protein
MKYQLQNYKYEHVNKDYTLKQPDKGTLCELPKLVLKALNIYMEKMTFQQKFKKVKPAN